MWLKRMLEKYFAYRKKKLFFLLLIFSLSVLAFLLSLVTGSYFLSLKDFLNALKHQDNTLLEIVYHIRLPRTVAGVLAGIGLSIAGAVLQCVLKNPLASPFTLGISHGAMFGAFLGILVFGFKTYYVIPFCAFMGSLIAVGTLLFLARIKNFSPEAMILTGVALSSLFTAGSMVIQYFASDIEVSAMVYWTFGDLGRALWKELFLISIVIFPSFVYFISKTWNFNVLNSGEETAKTLGIETERLRLITVLLSSLITSVLVAFLGIIGFVGLIAPHITKLFTGEDYTFLIPGSALFGALLLVLADIVARIILTPIILPVGIITSFLGAPLFLYLLVTLYK